MTDMERIERKLDRLTWLAAALIVLQFLPRILGAIELFTVAVVLILFATMVVSPKFRSQIPKMVRAVGRFIGSFFGRRNPVEY